MSDSIENITLEILKDLQKRLVDMGREMKYLRDDTREGFASLRSAIQSQQHDIILMERRMERVEEDVRLIKKATEFPSDPR
jgi:hypothetical protein